MRKTTQGRKTSTARTRTDRQPVAPKSRSKTAKQSGQGSEDLCRLGSDLSTDYIFKLKVKADGRVTMDRLTENFTTITGRTMEEAKTPDLWTKIIHPEDIGRLTALLKKLISKGGRVEFEGRSYVKGRRLRWVQVMARAIRSSDPPRTTAIVGAVKDITERKRVELALRESEEFYRSVVEHSQDGIVIFQDGIVKYANPRLAEMWGGPAEEEIGRPFVDFVPPDEVLKVSENYRRRMAGEAVPLIYETRILRKDGGTIAVEVSGAIISYDRRPADLLMIRDITERKQIEKILEETYKKYQDLFENAPIGIFHATADGRFLRVNPALALMLGYESPEQMVSMVKDIAKDIYVDSHKRSKILGEVLEKDGWIYAENSYRRRDGGILTANLSLRKVLNPDGSLAFLEGFAEEISERKRAEEDLNESHSLLQSTLESTADGILVVDRSGKIVYFNSRFAQLWRIPDEILALRDDQKALEFVLDQLSDADAFLAKVRKLYAHPKEDSSDHLEFKDGRVFERYSRPQRWEDGRIVGRVWSFRDVTERKRNEERILDALKEKETLLKEIHHRVKNNMQIISSLLRLQASNVTDPAVLDMFKSSQGRIRSMALVHEKLYASPDLSKINFSEYVRNLANHLFQSLRISPGAIRLKADLEDMFFDIQTAIPCGLILNELITNALKHAFPEGRSGEIEIILRVLDQNTRRLIVKDNGLGIPEKVDLKNPKSFGWQIVNLLSNQLAGRVEITRQNGTTVQIDFKETRYKQRF